MDGADVDGKHGNKGDEQPSAGRKCPAPPSFEEVGTGGESVAQRAEGGGRKPGSGNILAEAREEEQAAILAMLNRRVDFAPSSAGVGRASALAWAGLKVAAMVLLAAGVGHGLGDGDEFDEAGCSAAEQPA